MEAYRKYIESVEKIRPHLLGPIHVAIAGITTLIFKSRQVCISIWLVGPSSSGKGEIIRLISQLDDDHKPIEQSLFHRSDKFTENSFVSNRADVKTEVERRKLDLLRKLPSKVLVTAELGSFLTGNKEKLSEKFGTLTRVLDGEGLATDTGAHGHRSIDEKIEFVWIGGVTELTPGKHSALAAIGGRILPLDIHTNFLDSDELVKDIMNGFPVERSNNCSQFLSKFYFELFEKYPRDSVLPSDIVIPEPMANIIHDLSHLGALLRSNVTFEKDDESDFFSKASPEKPFRYAKNLHLLARASAILCGRTTVNLTDIASVVVPLVLSSGPEARHRVFEFMVNCGNHVSIAELQRSLHMGRTSIYEALKELKALNLMDEPDSMQVAQPMSHRFKVLEEHIRLFRKIWDGSNERMLPSPLILRTDRSQNRG